MRVLINALSSKTGGGTIFLKNLLSRIGSVDCANEYTVLLSNRYQNYVKGWETPNINLWYVNVPISAAARVIWEQTIFPIIVYDKYDVIFNTSELAPFVTSKRLILLVRNANVFDKTLPMKQQLNVFRTRNNVMKILAKHCIKKATWVIFPSNSMKKYIVEEMPDISSKSSVVHYGISDVFFSDKSSISHMNNVLNVSDRYILYVSSFAPHKNHARLLMAYTKVKKKCPDIKLVLVGGTYGKQDVKPGELNPEGTIREMILKYGIGKDVILTGNLEQECLPSIYRSAELFIFPSLTESFGHPLVEAMASGLPVLASNLGVSREICGDAAIYFDPYNIEDMAEKICDMLESDKKDSLRRKSINRAQMFSWDKAIKDIVEILI